MTSSDLRRPGADWHLLDERDLVSKSLQDAEREHAAGDLQDRDYQLLRRRDLQRLAELDEALQARGHERPHVPQAAPATLRRRWHRRWWHAAAGLTLVGAASVLLAIGLGGTRLPGEGPSGSVDLNSAQQVARDLAQGATLLTEHRDLAAMRVYGQALELDPKQPLALAEWGWLTWQAATKARSQGAAAEGASALVSSVRRDPGLYVGQYYLGAVLLDEGDPAGAAVHFSRFLHDRPPGSWVRAAAPVIRRADAAAHVRVPSALGHG